MKSLYDLDISLEYEQIVLRLNEEELLKAIAILLKNTNVRRFWISKLINPTTAHELEQYLDN